MFTVLKVFQPYRTTANKKWLNTVMSEGISIVYNNINNIIKKEHETLQIPRIRENSVILKQSFSRYFHFLGP